MNKFFCACEKLRLLPVEKKTPAVFLSVRTEDGLKGHKDKRSTWTIIRDTDAFRTTVKCRTFKSPRRVVQPLPPKPLDLAVSEAASGSVR